MLCCVGIRGDSQIGRVGVWLCRVRGNIAAAHTRIYAHTRGSQRARETTLSHALTPDDRGVDVGEQAALPRHGQ